MPDDRRLERIMLLFRQRGGRVTTGRLAIITALLEAPDHVTADDLVVAVQRTHPEVHRSTVYRTLEALSDADIIHHVHLGHGPAVYHVADDIHHHLVCNRCGAVIELSKTFFASLARGVAQEYGFRVDSNHFAVGGHCQACA